MNIYARGPDISSHQHDSGTPDFKKVKADGNDFIIIKATQGAGYVNPYFAADVAGARAAGLIVMPYHYMNSDDPQREVDAFMRQVKPVFPMGVLGWFDYEENTNHNILHRMEQILDPTPYFSGVYTYPEWWRLNGSRNCALCRRHPLWWADYNVPAVRPAPAPWGLVSIRQTHGTSYKVNGLPGLNDMNRAEVDLATLPGMGHLKKNPPVIVVKPKPTPPPIILEDDMARLISEDNNVTIYATNGVGSVWHVPNPTVKNDLTKTGVYGDGKVTLVSPGTVAALKAIE